MSQPPGRRKATRCCTNLRILCSLSPIPRGEEPERACTNYRATLKGKGGAGILASLKGGAGILACLKGGAGILACLKGGAGILACHRIREWRTFLSSRTNSNPLGGQECPRSRIRWQTGMSAPPSRQTRMTAPPLFRTCLELALTGNSLAPTGALRLRVLPHPTFRFCRYSSNCLRCWSCFVFNSLTSALIAWICVSWVSSSFSSRL